MNKPTHEDIKDLVNTIPYRKPINFCEFDNFDSFSIYYRYKVDAVAACNAINKKFGPWIHATTTNVFHPGVHVGYRQIELVECGYCGWLGGTHSQYCKRPKESKSETGQSTEKG